jgi:CheY-like chemotaxis protein
VFSNGLENSSSTYSGVFATCRYSCKGYHVANILLIEDEDMLRALYREILEIYGHSVTAAANGEDGIALFNDSIELVVTDMNMPRQSGLQTAAALRERAPKVPVIAMSGHPGQFEELSRFATGKAANRFLLKPFTPEVLCDAVTELLAHVSPMA